MTRNQFIAAMRIATEYEAQCDKLTKALATLLIDYRACITLGADLLAAHLDHIEEAVGDSGVAGLPLFNSWTRWYMYDSGGADRKCTVGGKKYVVKNAGQLYDVIQKWKTL